MNLGLPKTLHQPPIKFGHSLQVSVSAILPYPGMSLEDGMKLAHLTAFKSLFAWQNLPLNGNASGLPNENHFVGQPCVPSPLPQNETRNGLGKEQSWTALYSRMFLYSQI